jgi:3-oxoacyl-[acyl-carrier-protein] synthase-3
MGILASKLRADGRYNDKLYVDGGPSTTKTVGFLRMEGKEVFKHAVVNMVSVMDDVMKQAGFTADDIDWFVPHQANRRILDSTAHKLGLDAHKVVVTLDKHGNTSAASIPLAFDVAVKDGRIQPGHRVLMEAMGGGFTWGAVLLQL